MARESDRRRPKTLIWVIAVLGLLALVVLYIPYIPRVRDGRDVKQNAQFHSFEAAIDLFSNEFKGCPPSDANDPAGKPYCGAMKLAEALMGQDMLGFHSDSVFRADGKDANGVAELYGPIRNRQELKARKGPYLPPESADCLTLAQIYGQGNTAPFDPTARVLCDTYRHKYETGHKAGMPVLYYKADTSKTAHDVNNPDNIYNYRDNHALLALGVPGDPAAKHPLFTDPKLFYGIAKSDKVTTTSRPFKHDTYILISAGMDGLYGTKDDDCNFEFRFPEE